MSQYVKPVPEWDVDSFTVSLHSPDVMGQGMGWYQCQRFGKIFTGPTCKLLLSVTVILDVYRSCIPYKTTFTKYCLTQWVSKLKVQLYLVNSGKFHEFGGHRKCNCLQNWANFHRSRAWQTHLFFKTVWYHNRLEYNVNTMWYPSI